MRSATRSPTITSARSAWSSERRTGTRQRRIAGPQQPQARLGAQLPARRAAASPVPQKKSARGAPLIAPPVSWAITSRRRSASSPAARYTGAPSGMNAGSTAIERPAVSATPCAPRGPSAGSPSGSSWKNTTLGLASSTSRSALRMRSRARPGCPGCRPARASRHPGSRGSGRWSDRAVRSGRHTPGG